MNPLNSWLVELHESRAREMRRQGENASICKWIGLALCAVLIAALTGCTVTKDGSETSAVRHDLSRIAESSDRIASEGKAIRTLERSDLSDAKQIIEILDRYRK